MKKTVLLLIILIATICMSFAQKVVQLKSGKKLTVMENSAEDYIIAFLQNPNSSLDTNRVGNWYDLEQTKFELGKTTLEKTSFAQLKNIVTVIKEFPKLRIKIGSYCDKLGNEEANIKLTQARADACKKYLLNYGVPKMRIINSKGYGSTFAKYETTDELEDRVKDRKIAIQIVAF